MLRRQPVLHGDHPAAAVVCQLAELMVMRGETAADKAATVEIDNGRQCAGSVKGETTRNAMPSSSISST
jgi:hypothetical protein